MHALSCVERMPNSWCLILTESAMTERTATQPCEPAQRDEQMNQEGDDFAYLWIVAKRGQNDEFWPNLAIRHPHAPIAAEHCVSLRLAWLFFLAELTSQISCILKRFYLCLDEGITLPASSNWRTAPLAYALPPMVIDLSSMHCFSLPFSCS
jgi:hypothetical protein